MGLHGLSCNLGRMSPWVVSGFWENENGREWWQRWYIRGWGNAREKEITGEPRRREMVLAQCGE